MTLKQVRALAAKDPDWQWRHLSTNAKSGVQFSKGHRADLAQGWAKERAAEQAAKKSRMTTDFGDG